MTIKSTFFIIFIVIFLITSQSSKADRCRDYLLTDGGEPLVDLGIDTTGNWWVVSAPFHSKYRITISGFEYNVLDSMTKPIFSHNGENWAFFGYDVGSWKLYTRDNVRDFGTISPGAVKFSTISNELVYSVFRGDIEYVNIKDREIRIMHRIGDLFVSPWGDRFAFMIRRGNSIVVNINGTESDFFDEIYPAGFKENGEFVYAGRRGNGWRVYANNKDISTEFKEVIQIAINPAGNTVGVLVQSFNSRYQGVMFSDEYREPLYGMMYDRVWNLTVHPYLALIAYNASYNMSNYIVYSTTEYSAGLYPGSPKFSWDGDELYFIGCDMDCFVNINGRRYTIRGGISPESNITVAPRTNSFAYGSSLHLNMIYLETGGVHAGIMVDYSTPAIFNRFSNRYESLGVINNRVYLLTCMP